MRKEKDVHTHTLFAELWNLSIDVSVCTAGYVVVIDGKVLSIPFLHFLSFSDMLSFQYGDFPSNTG